MQRLCSFLFKIYLSNLFWAVVGLHCYASVPLLWRVGASHPPQGVKASHCGGFFFRAWALEQVSLSSCEAHVELLCGMWDLPGQGIKSVSSALAGRFSTTRPPGKSMLLQEKKKKPKQLF